MRKGAEKRTQREDGKACIVQVLASEHVSQTSNNRYKGSGDEHEAQDHPHYSHEVGLQMGQDLRQRNEQCRTLDSSEQNTDDGD